MANILVTGGAGFIASHLVDALIAQGNEVTVIDDLSSGLREYVNPQAAFVQASIGDPAIADLFFQNSFDLVYHLAAQIDVRKSVADPMADNDINVRGAYNILENCRKHKVRKLVFASTGGAIYGEADIVPTPEHYPASPLSPYGIHKFTFEKYLNYYHHVFGQDYTVLRFANVYGPRQYKGGEAGVIAIFTDKAVAGEICTIFGDGLQTRDFVFVEDVVLALLRAAEADFPGAINIGTGTEMTLLDVVSAIEKALGAKLSLEHAPAKLGEQRRSALDNSLAQQVLGWSPQYNLDSGIARTIAWAKNRSV